MDWIEWLEPSETAGERGVVAVVRLSQGDRPVVVLDRELLESLGAALDEVASASNLAGMVLASAAPRAFVAGADLREIMSLSDADLHSYLRLGSAVFAKVSALPCTTIAALNATALGGGLELAMHCDRLIAAAPAEGGKAYRVGLPEAALSICPGWGGTNLLPARMDAARAIELTTSGRTIPVTEAAECGLVSELVPGESLIARAASMSRSFKGRSRSEPISASSDDRRGAVEKGLSEVRDRLPETESADAVVECIEAGLEHGWQAALERERESLVRLRHTEEGRRAIEAFFAKSAGTA